MTSLPPISSRDTLQRAPESACCAVDTASVESDVTQDSAESFSTVLADVTEPAPESRPVGDPPNRTGSDTQKPPSSTSKPPTNEKSTRPAPDGISAPDAEQAQELPPEVNEPKRKTDAAPPPAAEAPTVTAPDATTIQTNSPDLQPSGADAAKKSNDRAANETEIKGGKESEKKPDKGSDAKADKKEGRDLQPTPNATESQQSTPIPQPAAQPAPVEISVAVLPASAPVKPNQPQAVQGHAEQSVESKESQAKDPSAEKSANTEQPRQPASTTSQRQATPPPAPGANIAPLPAPSANSSSTPSGAPSTFLDLQPQPAAPHASTSGAHATPSASASLAAGASEGAKGDEFSPQIVRGALAMTRSTGGAMTIRLEPETLGSMRIQMQMSQGRVSVQFHAETAQARGLLTQHVDTLRTAMESHGLKLENVQIQTLVKAGSPTSTGHEQPQSQGHSQSGSDAHARQDAGGQQSRGHGDTAEREAQYRQAARQFRNQGQTSSSWRQQWSQAAAQAGPSPAGATL